MRTILSSLVLLAFAATPGVAGDEALKAAVDRAVLTAPSSATLSVRIETVGGEVVYSRGAEAALVPASNMKLLTSAATLELLGPGFAHETRLGFLGKRGGGTLEGDLWIVGGGDPTISRRFDADPLLDELAASVKAAGVTTITGDLVVDDRVFDDVRLHPSWETSDAEHWYGAEVSGLSLNDGCVDVSVSGGPTLNLMPASDYLRLVVKAKSTTKRKQHRFGLVRAGKGKRELHLSGRIWTKAGKSTYSRPVPDPAAFFAAVLRARLAAHKIELRGGVRDARSGERYRGGFTAWMRKAPLPRTLKVLNQNSQNFYAECLIKTLGRRDGRGKLTRQGTWKRGAAVVRAYALAQCGVAKGEVVVSDGSGLSRDNRLSTRALVAVLRRALGGKHGAVFRQSMAQPGQKGTLKRRLRKLPEGAVLRAKTGTLTGVSALSGTITRGKRELYFSLIMNGKGTSRRHLDRVLTALAAGM
jgi:D-alanyl-D-alanine carboxypeptidase/D-alanyl-D-alanine-endopeptidase (penicillin-binding protein 4)